VWVKTNDGRTTVTNAFPFKIGQAVSGLVSPGPALCNGTVTTIGEPGLHGYRRVRVAFGKGREREYDVSRSGASDYLLSKPIRPTIDDDRVTPNDAYTVEPNNDGVFLAAFNGDPVGTFETEAEGWSCALTHDWNARESARLAKLNPTDVVIRCLSSDHEYAAIAAAKSGTEALEQFARNTLTVVPPWAAYATETAARDMRALGLDNVDWPTVFERFAR
jgi:hypothetical protein